MLEQDLETSEFKNLLSFVEFLKKDFKKICKERYGDSVFSNYISPNLDDFLCAMEEHISDLGEHVLSDQSEFRQEDYSGE